MKTQKMKVIRINTPKGQYDLPLSIVVENRTDYYAKSDGFEVDSKEWIEEYDWVYNDSFEAIDWLANNMDWEDIQEYVVKINDDVKTTDDDFWCSSEDFEIIDK